MRRVERNYVEFGEIHHHVFPGILFWYFPGMESPGKRVMLLAGPGKSCKSVNLLCESEKCEHFETTEDIVSKCEKDVLTNKVLENCC